MIKYNSRSFFSRAKSSFFDMCSQCKGRLIVISIICIISVITGIVISASMPSIFPADEYIIGFEGAKSSFGAFFSRTFSFTIVMLMIAVTTMTIYSFPISIILLGFRGYLIGFNICALCAGFGVSGLLDAIFIVLPCQLLMMFMLIFFCCFISKQHAVCRKYGGKGGERLRIFLWCFLVLVLINIIETLLLFIFSSKVILVI